MQTSAHDIFGRERDVWLMLMPAEEAAGAEERPRRTTNRTPRGSPP
jgi:hypothetical protein